jgi:hypothetical protein
MRHGQRPAREVSRDPRLPAGFTVRPDLTGITVEVRCTACKIWATPCQDCQDIQNGGQSCGR